MSVIRKKVFDAFRAAGVPDDKASAAAKAIEASCDEGLHRVGDELRGLDGRIRHVEQELLRLDGRVTLLTRMVGLDLTLTAAVLARLLIIH